MSDNLFTALAKYEKDENYWTAALLYVLEYLWRESEGSEEQRAICARFLTKLCRIPFTPNESISFDIQKVEKKGKGKSRIVLDARIKSDSKYVGIEVKDAAGFSQEPKDYKRSLEKSAGAQRHPCLVLLRRSYLDPADHEKIDGNVDSDVRWFKLYRWVDNMKSELENTGTSVGCYLLEQFLEFLNEKGVPIMAKVTEDGLKNGLKHIASLFNMLKGEAASISERRGLGIVATKDYVGTDAVGFYLADRKDAKEDESYGVEIDPENPSELMLCTTEAAVKRLENRRINRERLESLKNEKTLSEDCGWIYAQRELASVFQADNEEKQCDEVHRLLEEMLTDLDSIKLRKYEKR